MLAVSSRCENDSQLCFKCLHCLDSQATMLLQGYASVFVLVNAKYDFLCSWFSWYIKYSFYVSFSVSIWFKQSQCALNIDSNGHQKTKRTKNTKTFQNTKKTAQKHVFDISTWAAYNQCLLHDIVLFQIFEILSAWMMLWKMIYYRWVQMVASSSAWSLYCTFLSLCILFLFW